MKPERDDHIDEMIARAAKALEGEDLFDIACVGALLTSYAVAKGTFTDEQRHQLTERLIDFIRMTTDNCAMTGDHGPFLH